jgi:hypothetical protein
MAEIEFILIQALAAHFSKHGAEVIERVPDLSRSRMVEPQRWTVCPLRLCWRDSHLSLRGEIEADLVNKGLTSAELGYAHNRREPSALGSAQAIGIDRCLGKGLSAVGWLSRDDIGNDPEPPGLRPTRWFTAQQRAL